MSAASTLASISASLCALLLAACGDDGGAGPRDAAPDAAAIDTPPNTWTWVPFPGTTCGNGTPAGIGVHRSTTSDDLFVYFSGGGACWDGPTCFVQKSSIHIEDTYDAATLAAEVAFLQPDRSDPNNPLSRATFVYVPYCTGDLHAGVQTRTYPVGGVDRTVHHTGATNTQQFVERLRATLPGAATIYLAGSSAGGYGATLNFHRFASAWPAAQVHLLQDSSPFVEVRSNYAAWQGAWELQFPPGCSDCAASFPSVVGAVAAAHPSARIGLLHFDNDAVIRSYFGYPDSLVPATDALLAAQYARPNTKFFVQPGDGHTMIGGLATIPGLGPWVAQWVLGDPAWTSVR